VHHGTSEVGCERRLELGNRWSQCYYIRVGEVVGLRIWLSPEIFVLSGGVGLISWLGHPLAAGSRGFHQDITRLFAG